MPHLAEELWFKLGNKEFVMLQEWPTFEESKIDPEIDAQQDLIENTIRDIKRIFDFIKIEPKKATVSVAEEWKYNLIKNLKKEMEKTHDLKKIMDKVMDKKHAKDISKIVPSLLKNESKIPKVLLDQKTEIETLMKNKDLITEELGIPIEIEKNNPKAMPLKPGIQIE